MRMMALVRRAGSVGCALAGALVAACATATAPPGPPSCAAPCGVVEEVRFPDHLAVVLHVVAGTRLENAALASASMPGCRSGVPVAEVTVDEQSYPEGPAWLQRHSRLSFRFPFVSDGDAPEAGVTAPLVVDLDLGGSGGRRCLRLPLPDPGGGFMALGRRLSLRLQVRE
jgi:hypothetical protein